MFGMIKRIDFSGYDKDSYYNPEKKNRKVDNFKDETGGIPVTELLV